MSAGVSFLSPGDLLVTVDLAARRAGRVGRLRARHGVRGDQVTAVSTSFTGEVEIVRLDLAGWCEKLTRTLTVAAPETAADVPVSPPTPAVLLPWELLIGTGAARARHRPEVYDVLVARAVGSCTSGGRTLDLPGCHAELRRLHAATGRMRATGAGVGPQGPRLGTASWVLLAEGWHALVPVAEAGRAMVRVEQRRPADLAVDAATWLAAVRR